jgi:hypothetical protein
VDDELIAQQPTQVIAFLFSVDAFGAVSRSVGRRARRGKTITIPSLRRVAPKRRDVRPAAAEHGLKTWSLRGGEVKRAAVGGGVRMTDVRIERLSRELQPRSSSRAGRPRQPVDPTLTCPVDGIRLSRLIALAGLTVQQAVEVGAAVLAEAVSRAAPDLAGLSGDRVLVDAAGQVVLVPGPRDGQLATPADATASGLVAVLGELAGAARRRTRCPEPGTAELLAELDQAATQIPAAGVRAAAQTLAEAVAAIDRRAAQAELGVLVRAVLGQPGTAGDGGPAGIGASDRGRPAQRHPRPRARVAVRRTWTWLASIAVLVAVVLLEIAVLRDEIAADVDLLLDVGRSGSAPSSASRPDGLPVVAPAPAAAGLVTAVNLRTVGTCTPGSPCTVRVQVRLLPHADPQTVTWSFGVVDRCAGVMNNVPGGTLSVPPGGDRAVAIGTVGLPPATAVAVLAVTEVPAKAAGPPVLLGSCAPDRPAQ